MSSLMVTFYDNLVAHLAAAETLPELTERQILFVTGPADEEQINAIDQHVQMRVMKTKGIGVVIFEAGMTNEARDSQDGVIMARLNFEVRLFIHPQKWGPKYDPTKRKAREIVGALLEVLNGADIAPTGRGCHDYTMVDSMIPIPDPEFWAWNIEASRAMPM